VTTIQNHLASARVMAARVTRGIGGAVRHLGRDQRGQTPTEYLMIVGFMAAVIVAVFVMAYWDAVDPIAREWLRRVTDTVSGGTTGAR
jgi:Flp pilus assembly pilin Flp